MQVRSYVFSRSAIVSLVLAGIAAGQDVIPAGNCVGVPLADRAIRSVHISSPFDALRLAFVRTLESSLETEVADTVGPRYTDRKADAAMDLLAGTDLSPPRTFGLPIKVSLVTLRPTNCVDAAGVPMVDLNFFFFPASVAPFLGYSKESHAEQTTDGARAAGVAPRHHWISPTASYSATSKVVPGFSAGLDQPLRGVQKLIVNGGASSQLRFLNLAVSGSYEPDRKWIKRADFTAGFGYRDEPAAAARLQAGRGFLEWKAASDVVPGAKVVVRYGFGGEGGVRRAYSAATVFGVVPNTRLGAVQGFAGVTRRWTHQSIAASYAVQGAKTGSGGAFDYARHFVDASHSLSVAPGHYPIEVDTRFSLGQITGLCQRPGCGAPLTERFFAGNVEHNFLSDNSWVIRSQPLLRSLPINAFGGSNGFGGNGFRAFNLTAAFAVARNTLIPEELLNQQNFLQRIDALPDAATELLAAAYASLDTDFDKDPGIVAARALLTPIRSELTAIRPTWDARAGSVPAAQKDDFDVCTTDSLDIVPLDLDDVDAGNKRITLVSNRSSALAQSIKCLRQFNSGPGNELAASAARLEKIREAIDDAVSKTDIYARARKQAVNDMALGKSTIHTLFHEANLVSVSPVFVFDAVTLPPQVSGTPVWRYGIGGGGRLTILSTVRFTFGYAFNVRRRPGEGGGALFAAMDILDIFGRR